MAYGSKQLGNRNMPVDEPRLVRPGVLMKESDFHASAKFLDAALPLSHPERARKGDLSEATRPAARSSFEYGRDFSPFAFRTPRIK